MGILLDCTCGKKLNAPDELAGKRVKCPGCGDVLTVERILDAIPELPELDEQAAFEPIDATPRPSRKDSFSASPVNDAPRPQLEDDESLYDRADRKRRLADQPSTTWWSSAGGQVCGGLLLMLGAIVWFVFGLFAHHIFFYPIVLFIGGIIGVVKGLVECMKTPFRQDDDEADDYED